MKIILALCLPAGLALAVYAKWAFISGDPMTLAYIVGAAILLTLSISSIKE